MPKDHLPTWFLPELKLAARPALLMLATLLLGGLGVGLKHFQARPRPESADFDLLADSSSSKLDNTSAEMPESQSAPAFTAEADETRQQAAAPVAEEFVIPAQDIPAPVADSPGELQSSDSSGPYKVPDLAAEPPKPEMAEAVPTKESSAPQVFEDETFRNSQRGETPMIRNWKMLGLQTVLAAALAAAPSPADADDNKSEAAKKNSDNKAEPTLKDLKKSLDQISEELDKIRVQAAAASALAQDLGELKKQVARLQSDVNAMRSRTTSLYGPTSTGTGTGHIRLENQYPFDMIVVLNQTAYPLPPGQTVRVQVPAGPFSYQVRNIPGFGVRNRDVLPNETFSITIFPQ